MSQYTMDIPSYIPTNGLTSWNTYIGLDVNIIIELALIVVEKEMKVVREEYKDVDWYKVEDMLNSYDVEMSNLGESIMTKHTKYAGRILYSLRRNDDVNVLNLIREFIENNKFKITERII